MSIQYEKLIIDGNNLLYKAFFSKKKPKIIKNIDVGPIYRFLSMLKNLSEYYRPNEILFTWDKKLNPNVSSFRKELYPDYKGNRVESEDRAKIHAYCDIMIQFCNTLGITTILPYDLEADDVIKYITDNSTGKCLMVSSDRDLLQLINEDVHQLISSTKNIIVDLNNFEEYAGCEAKHFLLYKSILGDDSDNIKGLSKYGIVKARDLAEKLDNKIININDLTDEQRAIIDINLKIINLQNGLKYRPNDESYFIKQWNSYKDKSFDGEAFVALTEQYGLGGFRRQLGTWKSAFSRNSFSEDDWFSNITM